MKDLDDDALLVHADELIEKGDPRGEFITTSMALERAGIRGMGDLISADVDDTELARLAQLYRRRVELETANTDRWRGELIGPSSDRDRVRYERGLPANLKLAQTDAEQLKQLANLSVVRVLEVCYLRDQAEVLRFLARLPQLRKLTLFHGIRHEALLDLGALPHGKSLVELTLFRATDRAGLDRLAAHPLAAQLEVLELTFCDALGDDALLALDGRFPRLRALNLHGVGVTAKGIAAAANRTLVVPRDLVLHDNAIKSPGAAALAGWPLDNVRRLGVGSCGLRDAGVKALMASKHLGRLEELELSDSALTDAGAAAIANARLPRLASLNLQKNSVRAKALAKIVEAHALRELRFDPKRGDGDASIVALARSPHAAALRDITFVGSQVTDEGAHTLASTPALAGVRGLRQFACAMSDAGVREILKSPHLRRLVSLVLSGKRLRRVDAPTLPTMVHLEVG